MLREGEQPDNEDSASIFSIVFFVLVYMTQGVSVELNAGLIVIVYTSQLLWRKRLTSGIVAHGIYNSLVFLGLYFLLK